MKYNYRLNMTIRDERSFRIASFALLEFIRSILRPLNVDSGVVNNLDGTCTFKIDSDKKAPADWVTTINAHVFTEHSSDFSTSTFFLNGEQVGGTCHYIYTPPVRNTYRQYS